MIPALSQACRPATIGIDVGSKPTPLTACHVYQLVVLKSQTHSIFNSIHSLSINFKRSFRGNCLRQLVSVKWRVLDFHMV